MLTAAVVSAFVENKEMTITNRMCRPDERHKTKSPAFSKLFHLVVGKMAADRFPIDRQDRSLF